MMYYGNMIFIKAQPIETKPLFSLSVSKELEAFGLDPVIAQVSKLKSVKQQNLEENVNLGEEAG